MPVGIGKREKLGGKEDSRFLGLSGWINSGFEICQNFGIWDLNFYSFFAEKEL